MAAEDGFIALAFVLCFSIFLSQTIKEPQKGIINNWSKLLDSTNNIMCFKMLNQFCRLQLKSKFVFLLFWLLGAQKMKFNMCKNFPLDKIFTDYYPYILNPGSNVVFCFVFSLTNTQHV